MAILQVRDIDDHLYSALKTAAKTDCRSISQEVVAILAKYLANPEFCNRSPTIDFLSLSGAWDDDRSAEAIVGSLRAKRKNSKRFEADDAVFN